MLTVNRHNQPSKRDSQRQIPAIQNPGDESSMFLHDMGYGSGMKMKGNVKRAGDMPVASN
jgi:hypothetical protein